MNSLTRDSVSIWRAGVEAVDSRRLVDSAVRVAGHWLDVGPHRFPLHQRTRIFVVGAGKAGAGMAAGVEQALQGIARPWSDPRDHGDGGTPLSGWVNVPADCVQSLPHIQLHAARPPGRNEPTEEGAAGAAEILRSVGALTEDDICLCLLSGGGSALLPAPVEGVTLADKQSLTRELSAAGANIQQLNAVRKQLSRIKGGGLAASCRAGTLHTLIISDVIGDPLDVIASGPTVPDSSTPDEALRVLLEFGVESVAPAATEHLRRQVARADETRATARFVAPPVNRQLVIGNNQVAVEASATEAQRLGYETVAEPATCLEGDADPVGRELATRAQQLSPGRRCVITGGEPTVTLAPPERRGRGGRNQQLVLAAIDQWKAACRGELSWVLLSGGTDGEDGPTDAAGAWMDRDVLHRCSQLGLDAADFLRRNDAYAFFQQAGGLLRTGPTHTNVCDVRVILRDETSFS